MSKSKTGQNEHIHSFPGISDYHFCNSPDSLKDTVKRFKYKIRDLEKKHSEYEKDFERA